MAVSGWLLETTSKQARDPDGSRPKADRAKLPWRTEALRVSLILGGPYSLAHEKKHSLNLWLSYSFCGLATMIYYRRTVSWVLF